MLLSSGIEFHTNQLSFPSRACGRNPLRRRRISGGLRGRFPLSREWLHSGAPGHLNWHR